MLLWLAIINFIENKVVQQLQQPELSQHLRLPIPLFFHISLLD